MTRPRPSTAAIAICALACGLALTACTGSSGGATSTDTPAAIAESTTSVPPGTGTSTGTTTSNDTGTTSGPTDAPPPGGTRSSAGPSEPKAPQRTITVQGVHATYTVRVYAGFRATACVPYAAGAARTFLRTHPCQLIDRYRATTIVGSRQVGVSVARLAFAGSKTVAARSAAQFTARALQSAGTRVDTAFPLSGQLPAGPSIAPAARTSTARNDGANATVADAWYLGSADSADQPALNEMLEALAS